MVQNLPSPSALCEKILPGPAVDGLAGPMSRVGSRIPALDGVRALAIILVVLHHYELRGIPTLGLTISFVLSGFLVTSLLIREHERTNTICLRNFLQKRVLRLLPAFYLYLFVITGLMYIGGVTIHWNQIAAAFFFVMDYYRALTGSDTPQGWIVWSLAVEQKFYLLWPLFLYAFRNRLKRAAASTALVIVCIGLYRIALVTFFHVSNSYIYNAFETRLDGILIGCLLAICLKRKIAEPFFRWVTGKPGFAAIPAGVIIACIYFADYKKVCHFYEEVGLTLIPISIALLLSQVIRWSDHIWFQWLACRPLGYVAAISYGLYLFHIPAHQCVTFLLPQASATVRFFVPLFGSLVAAAISSEFVEKPFIAFNESLSKGIALVKPNSLRPPVTVQIKVKHAFAAPLHLLRKAS